MITSTLSERTTSAFSLSIGTSLSMESIFEGQKPAYDPERPIPNKIDIGKYDEFWINVFTLYRNIIGSVPSNLVQSLMPDDIAYVLNEEIELIRELVKMYTGDKVKVITYSCDYRFSDLKKKHPHAKIRTDTTDRQRMMTDLTGQSISYYYRLSPLNEFSKHYSLGIGDVKSISKKVLLLSNYAYDLLSNNKFLKMDLLESHTGVLKEKPKWYTKYTDGKNLNRLPFNSCFLQVFGDSQTFHPMDKALREEVKSLAEEKNWNTLTSNERIRFTLSSMKNQYFAEILKSMF